MPTIIESEEPRESDKELGRFLAFLDSNIASHPELIQAIDESLKQRIQSLVGDVEIDLDAALPACD